MPFLSDRKTAKSTTPTTTHCWTTQYLYSDTKLLAAWTGLNRLIGCLGIETCIVCSISAQTRQEHTTYSRTNMGQKYEGNYGVWVLNEIIEKRYPENLKKLWEPFGSYLLNSTANPAHFYSNWAGLAVLLSRYLFPKRLSRFFFKFSGYVL